MINKIQKICSILLLPFLLNDVAADQTVRADSHAPIGVMGDHTHEAGEFMWSYRLMYMQMDGNRDGTNRLAPSDILRPAGQFMVTPLDMDMTMHMFGLMYAPTSRWTLMWMLPFIDFSMDHLTAMGVNFTTESDGFGDLKFTGLYSLHKTDRNQWILNLGVSLPTGSIDEQDVTPASAPNATQLPYPMQLGSGTVDFMPGITFTSSQLSYSWGAQLMAVIRNGENDNDYTLGNKLEITTWYARPFADRWSWSTRLSYQDLDNIDGADPRLNPMMVPTADPDRRGGTRVDFGFGLNLIMPGTDKTNRLALEIETPVQQDLDGPQLETDLSITLGWQLSY